MLSTKALIIGLGNPILGDDGVGWRVAEQVISRLREQPARNGHAVSVERLSVGGLALMERLVGYNRAILIDAITVGEGEVGDLLCVSLDALPDYTAGHLNSAHDASLKTALQMGREMGYMLPDEIWVVGVRADRVREFSEHLSGRVESAVQVAADRVLELLATTMEWSQS